MFDWLLLNKRFQNEFLPTMPVSRDVLEMPMLAGALGLNTIGFMVATITLLIPPYAYIKLYLALVLVMSAAHFLICLQFVKKKTLSENKDALLVWNSTLVFNCSLAISFSIAMQESATYAGSSGFFLILVGQVVHLYNSFREK
eukprot:NODE_6_length_70510_cov_1.054395.p52 type:complete len:143 gc:universal NODE_6_length_70510_cov_1.054395:26747-27175(+)